MSDPYAEALSNALIETRPNPIPTLKRTAPMNSSDFFPTPAWCTHALMQSETFTGRVWEPACGNGSMAKVIESYGHKTFATDLNDFGYGKTGYDFLKLNQKIENIITNPPYNKAEEFLHKCCHSATDKFALLLRLAFLEGVKRRESVFKRRFPSRVWIFSERPTFYAPGTERKGSGTTAYCWMVWDHKQRKGTEVKWLKPGFKKKYGD